jgi:uncharacterized repeat protein (TIGR01451 family)
VDSPPSTVITPPAGISLVKEVNGQHEPTAPGLFVPVDSNVTFSYLVTNTSGLTLDSVQLTDDVLGAISCPNQTLTPDESMTCTAPSTPAATGQQTNTATAAGQPVDNTNTPVGPQVTATDTGNYFGATPSLTVTKSASPATVTAPGQVVIYTFTLKNTGNVTLTGERVNDVLPGLSAITCTPTSLGPGASTTCTATYSVTQTDIDKGSVTNTATATATPPPGLSPPDSPPSSATVPVTQNPGITLVKSASPTLFSGAGTVITYSYKVTNTGNVTLTSVKVTDPMPGLSTVTCPRMTLVPAASLTCTATYTTTQADVTRGSIKNVATASAVDPAGVPMLSASSTVIIPGLPLAPESPITPVTVPVTG